MYENNNQGEHDLTPARIKELKSAGWSVPLDTEAVEDGARNIRLNADKAALSVDAAARSAAEAKATAAAAAPAAALGEFTRRLGAVESTANTAKSGIEQLRGSIATHEIRIQANEERLNTLESSAPAPAPAGSSGLTGIGRPDTPSTLSTDMRQTVAAAPVGVIFTSTDGASVGAWTWQKTTTGWEVTYGDTGWRSIRVPHLQSGSLWVRRTQAGCFITLNGGQYGTATVAAGSGSRQISGAIQGFRSPIAIRVELHSSQLSGGQHLFMTAKNDGGGVLQLRGEFSSSVQLRAGIAFYPAVDPWVSQLPGIPA